MGGWRRSPSPGRRRGSSGSAFSSKGLERRRWTPSPRTRTEALSLQGRPWTGCDSGLAGPSTRFLRPAPPERPAGRQRLDPGFRELMTPEFIARWPGGRFWKRPSWSGGRRRGPPPGGDGAGRASPGTLQGVLLSHDGQSGCEVPHPGGGAPGPLYHRFRIRKRLEALLEQGLGNFPETEPAGGWDRGMGHPPGNSASPGVPRVGPRTTHFMESLGRWFCNRKSFEMTLKRWVDPDEAKGVQGQMERRHRARGPGARTTGAAGMPYRLSPGDPLVREADRGVPGRCVSGNEDPSPFQDLLEGAPPSLRDHPEARTDLGEALPAAPGGRVPGHGSACRRRCSSCWRSEPGAGLPGASRLRACRRGGGGVGGGP